MGTRTHSVLPPDTLDEVVAGRLGAEGVHRVALEPLRHGLAELLDDCLPGDGPRGPLDLLRTKFKPGRKLTAYYAVPLGLDGGGRRHLAVSWSADGRISALVSPADPAMPQLGRLSEAAYLVTVLAELTGRPVDARVLPRIRTVRYRPGQRHVLHLVPGPGRPGVFVKLDRDDSGARAVPVAETLGPRLARQCPGAELAKPVGYATHDRAALWQQSLGQPLWHRLTTDIAAALKPVELVGRALRALHDSQPGAGAGPQGAMTPLGSHDVEAEVAATLRAGEHIMMLLPSVGATYRELAAEAADLVARLPSEEARFTHGDVKCDNILVDDTRVRLLDLDRSGWADPALDLAKFVADQRWWSSTGEAGSDALTSALRTGYGACDPARWARANVLAVLFQLKLAARRCAVHDLAWPVRMRSQVNRAAAALSSVRES